MHVLVTPMRQLGIALDPNERRSYKAVKGNLVVTSELNADLGRSVRVARVDVGLPLDTGPLPQLLDASLVGMSVTWFVLSGIEYIDGCAYAQS